jgi:hypothetical protein
MWYNKAIKGTEDTKMTYEEMLTTYSAKSAAHSYIVGFVQNGTIFYIRTGWENLVGMLKRDRAAASKGGMLKWRVKLTSAMKKAAIASGEAVRLGAENLLDTNDKYNKGERFERLITETLTSETWTKDSVPFWMAGDIRVNGEEIQIKFDGAELTNERTLGRLVAA